MAKEYTEKAILYNKIHAKCNAANLDDYVKPTRRRLNARKRGGCDVDGGTSREFHVPLANDCEYILDIRSRYLARDRLITFELIKSMSIDNDSPKKALSTTLCEYKKMFKIPLVARFELDPTMTTDENAVYNYLVDLAKRTEREIICEILQNSVPEKIDAVANLLLTAIHSLLKSRQVYARDKIDAIKRVVTSEKFDKFGVAEPEKVAFLRDLLRKADFFAPENIEIDWKKIPKIAKFDEKKYAIAQKDEEETRKVIEKVAEFVINSEVKCIEIACEIEHKYNANLRNIVILAGIINSLNSNNLNDSDDANVEDLH